MQTKRPILVSKESCNTTNFDCEALFKWIELLLETSAGQQVSRELSNRSVGFGGVGGPLGPVVANEKPGPVMTAMEAS